MLEVEPASVAVRPATGSGRNAIEAVKPTSSISRKRSEIEPWLQLNMNRKSQAAYRLPCMVVGNANSPETSEMAIGWGITSFGHHRGDTACFVE